jgi:hypothetical protein
LNFARHRHDAIVAGSLRSGVHSQVFSSQLFSTGKDCNEGLSKAGRRIAPRASRDGRTEKKLRPPEDLYGRSRMPQSREGETQAADFKPEAGSPAQSFSDQD